LCAKFSFCKVDWKITIERINFIHKEKKKGKVPETAGPKNNDDDDDNNKNNPANPKQVGVCQISNPT
jgi:hypothetical protein